MNSGGASTAYREPGARRTLPTLDNLTVASPCTVSWDRMLGNGRVRECADCSKQVFNISHMSRADAEVLLRERTEGVCVRFYRRFDGTILTADCPVGLRAKLGTSRLLSAALGAGLAFLALLGLQRLAGTSLLGTKVSSATMGTGCASQGAWERR